MLVLGVTPLNSLVGDGLMANTLVLVKINKLLLKFVEFLVLLILIIIDDLLFYNYFLYFFPKN